MLTRQEIFDISARQIISQGYLQSMDESGRFCRYRGTNGRMCAAGPSTPEDVEEGCGVTGVPLVDVGDQDRLFLGQLQVAHDHALARGYLAWEAAVRKVAERHDLSGEVLRSKEAFGFCPFGTVESAIEFAKEVDASLNFEGLIFDTVEDVREHVSKCWGDGSAKNSAPPC